VKAGGKQSFTLISCFAFSSTLKMKAMGSSEMSVDFLESQNYFTTGGLPPISSPWRQAP
jgi:hypothetical protein